MRRFLFLIPARSGSKGVPRKNVALIAGRPLIDWTLVAALGCRRAASARVVVSTDSEEIATVARACSAEVPFLRPESLAGDTVPAVDVVLHAAGWLEAHDGYRPDYIVLLQPTSPLRESVDIDGAIDIALTKDAAAVVSVTNAPSHPYWTKKLGAAGELEDFLPVTSSVSRRQDLPEAYSLNGAIYVIKPQVLAVHRRWCPDPTYPYIMPEERSLDIDTPWDLHLADLILRDRMGASK